MNPPLMQLPKQKKPKKNSNTVIDMNLPKHLLYRMGLSFAILVLIDQLSKIVVSYNIPLGQSKTLIPGLLSIVKVHNRGTIWGLGQGGNMIFAFLAIIVVFLILVFVPKIIKDKSSSIAIGMILGGAIGNLIDRFARGFVVDFIHLEFINFPVFNIADSGIVVSAIILVYVMIFNETKNDS